MKKFLKIAVLSVAALCSVVSAYAQITTSSIAGRVNDSVGPVPGAVIKAVYTPSGSQYYTVADKNGNYRINSVIPGGPYVITVESLGYQIVTVKDVYAPLAETFEYDVTLQDESIALDAVTVSADSNESGMNIRRSGMGTSISRRTMENVPSVGRSMNDIMALTPQASTTTSGFAVGGGNYRGSSVTVDGAAFNNAFGIGSNLPAGGSPISLDALEQMSINITPFDVRQSGFQGGAINAVTKSGSNEFHASAYNYYTSDAIQGKKVGEGTLSAESLNNTIGVTVGGPIIKNKLFFFVNAEYSLDTVPGATYQARPNGTEEWGSKTAYHRPTVAGLDEIKAFVGEQFGYNPGRYQGYSLETPDYKVLARIDWVINDSNRLNVRFSHTHTFGSNSPSSSMSPIGGTDSSFGSVKFNRYSAGRQSDYTMPFESARYFQEQNFTSVSAELNSRLFDGGANNMFRLTWSHQDEPRSYVGNFFPTVDILDKTDVKAPDNSAMYTTIGLDPFTYGNLRDVQTITATDEYTFTRGINNFIVGAQLEWNRAVNGYMQGGAGWFIYDSFDTFKNDVLNPGDSTYPIAFMITHANLDDPTSQTFPSFDYTQVSVYGQDEIAFSDYFKLTAGLRVEMPFITIPTDNENKDFSAVAAANPNSSFAGLSTADVPAARLSLSPRVGFNWDVLKNRSLIVRGGTGIYTGRIPNVWLVSAVGNSNCLQYQYIANDKTGSPKIHFSDSRAEIINSIYSSGKFEKQDLAANTAATVIAKDLKMPSSWKSSLAVDAKLPGGIKGTIEGVYSYNFNEVYATSLGYSKEAAGIRLPGEPQDRSSWVSEGIKNKDGSKMNGYYVQNMSDFHGQYYAITASLSKSFACGLDLMAAYTRSGATSLSDGNGDQISEFANTYCLNGCNEPVLGNAFYVSPNRLIANASYTIKEGSRTATKLSAFYEGYNIGFISSYSYSRVSYLMDNQSGAGTASQLIYIPTDKDIDAMSFATLNNVKDSEGNEMLDASKKNITAWTIDDGSMKQAYKDFLADDKYTSKHRGEYSKRNGIVAPWLNRLNVRVAQDFYFDVAGKTQTIELGVDIKNVGNMINSEWGVYKQLSSNTILTYQSNNPAEGAEKATYYTFTEPVWKNYNNLASTWQMLFSARWFF